MKSAFSRITKRWLSLLLAVMMIATMIPLSAITAFAFSTTTGQTVDSEYGGAYIGYDGAEYPVGANHYALRYNSDGTTYIEPSQIGTRRTKLNIVENGVRRQALCIEYGVDIIRGTDTYVSANSENSAYFNMLPMTARRGILLACVYGWHPGKALPISGINEDDYSLATQEIIWEYQQGIRTSPTTRVNNGNIRADQFYDEIKGRPAELAYNWILSKMAAHATVPSFATSNRDNAQTYTLKYDSGTGKYSLTLTDTNNTGVDIAVTSGSGVSVSRSGNKYTFTASSPINNAVTVEYKKNIELYGEAFLVWGNVGNQTMITGVSDPIRFYAAFNTEANGTGRIVKTSEDGKVSGISFKITGNGVDKTVTTGSNGYVDVDLLPGTYTVTEITEDQYEAQSPKTVTVVSGQTATVSFNNTLKRGDLKIVKTSEDDIVSGVPFVVSGNGITKNVTTDANGEIKLEGLLPGTYTVTEQHKDYYEPQQSKTVTVAYNQTATVSFNNVLKRGDLIVTKTAEDGLTEGIKFRLTGTSDSGVKIDITATVDSTGKAYFKDILVGSGYVLEEVDTDLKYIVPDSQDVEIEWAKVTSAEVYNELKRGDLKIVKTSEDGLVEGMRFHLYGTSLSGEKVSVYAYTDKNGVALFEDILIGENYTVEEVDTAERYIIPDSQTAEIEWNKVTQKSFYNKLKRGDLKIIKTSEDGLVEGMKFHLYGTSLSGEKVDKYAYTDKNGVALFEDILIGENYTVEEVETAERYIIPDSQTAEIEWNKVTQKSFYNELKRGDLKVVKTSEDNFVEGMRFRLYGTSLSGEKVDVYANTDANGVALFENILIGENYTIEEVKTPIRYVIPNSQDVVIKWNEVTEATVHNVLKKWRADVLKVDREIWNDPGESDSGIIPFALSLNNAPAEVSEGVTFDYGWPYGETQGDATLEGAVYGVYKDGALIDTYTTDKNGQFITNYYPCYENVEWTIREINPSEGYLLDPTVYYPDTNAELYTIELNTVYPDVYEDIIKGKITIIKHTDDGSTKIETPEVGAMFEVYLGSAGSYEAAETTERDILTCDEFGYAETIDLPYGVYVVRQIKGWEGRELLDPFEVFVSEDGEIYRYLINNANFESYLHVVKVDSTTGKTIPYAGAGFQIYAPDGKLVTMSYTYPTLTVIDTFYTDENGTLLTPEKLPYGEGYSLVEVQAPHGYVLDATPIYFDVTEENSADENGITIVKVVKENEPQKGTITITKTGEVFSSVVEQNGVYQPVYEIKGLAGAVYEITAAEDVVTLDGTLRYKKGDMVATITTGADGTATTEPLFLGKFEIREITAPHGMILNGDTVTAELTYAGQEIKITTTSASFVNERQKVEIDLSKTLEQDEKYGIGMNGEISSVQFGLYVSEDITAADGNVIPKDGIIETVTCDENGKAIFATDLPVGAKVYVKEIATDNHYILSDSTYPVTFDYAGQDTAVVKISVNNGEAIENEIVRGNIIGKKLDEDGFTICGALFGLFRENETEFTEETAIATCQSNEIGVFTFEDVPFGRWIVREIKAAPAFVLNENSYAVTVSTDEEVIEITIENEFITGSVKTTKVDKEYPDNKLSGAVFEVYVDVDNNGEFDPEIDLFVGEMAESENGIYEMHDLRYNGYFLYEKTAPEGFVKDDTYHYFEIRNDGETVIVENEAGVGFTNQPILGNVTTTKVDKEYPDNKLSGAVFEIYKDVDGNGEFDAEVDILVGEMTETEAGVYLYEKLRYGGYFLYEKTAPEGFVKDDTYHWFEIRNDGETVTVENEAGIGFTNKPILGNVTTTKVDKDYPDNKLSGAVFEIYKDVDGNSEFNAEIDTIVGEMTETEVGVYLYEKLRYGCYFLYEKTSPEGFVKDDGYHYFEIRNDGETVTVENEAGVGFNNRPIIGNVQLTKIDKDSPDNKLSGAVFEVYMDVDANGEFSVDIDKLVGEMTESDVGVYTMNDLRYNGYFLHEKTAPEGFVKDDSYHYLEIRNDGETIIVENEIGVGFTDKPILGNVTVTKVDAESPDNKLSGAIFEIFRDTNNNGIFDTDVDAFIGEMIETEAGAYLYEKLRYGGYFLYEKTAPEGFVKDDGYHYFEIRNDGETVTLENEAGVGFTNKPIVGELELTKTDISDGKLLANVGFRIRNEAGDIVAEGYTDENGIAKFTLRYGKYTYEEFAALGGYVPDDMKYPFEIKEDGEIVKAEMTNEKIPEVPQTGDNSNLGFWIGLAGVALGGLIATAIIIIKQKKDDDD